MRKTSRGRNARQVPKIHKTNTTNVCAQLLTEEVASVMVTCVMTLGSLFFFNILWPDTQPLPPRRRFPTPSPKFGCVQRASLGSNPGLKHFIQTLRSIQELSYSSWFSDVHQTRACKRPTWKRSTYRSGTLPLALELHARQQHGWSYGRSLREVLNRRRWRCAQGWSWLRKLGRHLLNVQLHWRQCRDRGRCCATDSRH